MVAAYVADVERLVSQSRLDRYRVPGSDLETMVTYLWNVALSEALLQGICSVEIAIRNAIHNAFTAHYGTDQWFWKCLKKEDLKVINGKWIELANSLGQPPTSGKIIAHLTLGFWPYLFEHRYHAMWWDNGEALLKAVFSHLPMNVPPYQKIGRQEVFNRLKNFAELRNRAMHHEPIFFGLAQPQLGNPPPIVPLADIHFQMKEMLDWISPQHGLTLSFVDRFDDVLQDGQTDIRDKIKRHFNIP